MQPDSKRLDARWFGRVDDSSDSLFYEQPRKVVHIDEGAIEAVTELYRELLPAGGAILDLMSSWRSHLPQDVAHKRICGLGMNDAEMADNPQLSDWLVHNLNATPKVPFADGEFNGACCCVSIQYMQQPYAVFAEVARVLTPDAPFIVTFSNRCFPTKAINAWRMSNDEAHSQIVENYFHEEPTFRDTTSRTFKPTFSDVEHQNPLYAVWGFRT